MRYTAIVSLAMWLTFAVTNASPLPAKSDRGTRKIYIQNIIASLFQSSESMPLQYEDLEDLPEIVSAQMPHKLVKVEGLPGLSISVAVGQDAASSKVSVSGYLQHIISDTERMTFHLSDYELKQAVGKYFGKNPDDAFLHSPTPWNDLYKRYGWDQVQTVLEPVSHEIVGVTTKFVAIKSQHFENHSSKSGRFDVSISETVSDTVTSTWQTGGSLSFGQKINYGVEFLGIGVGGETSFGYTRSWGEGGSHEESQTVSSSSSVIVTLEPHQSVKAVLTATRSVLKIRVKYNAYLTGDVAINYGSRYKGHHFWRHAIQDVMNGGNIQNSVQSTEDIEVGYYSNGKIVLQDAKTNKNLATYFL